MATPRQFEGKVAMVTGAGTGIGADTALLLAERGAKVVIVGRREAPLQEVEKRILAGGGEVLIAVADVSDISQVEKVVERTLERFGALHYGVNNAGISGENFDLPDLPKEVWDETIAINLSSIFYCMKAQLRAIDQAGGGAIVNVSSVFADRGLVRRAPYTATKHAIRGITRATAADWAARKIRINELQPGVIATPMTVVNPEESAQVASTIAAKRLGEPRECATAIAFLLSDDASYITGAHLAVDGGYLA
ncbi:NAD(P)-binding protein [Penicillium herquei]|nr:NAD(P)-binding protein [Penicillium herquei]